MRRILLVLSVVALASGCGDPPTEDARGYTKAPLEAPGLVVRGEPDPGLSGVSASLEPGLTGTHPDAFEEAREGGAGQGPAGDDGDEEVDLAAGVEREQYDQGRQLFTGGGGCQACHGMDATGTQLGPDLTDGEWLHVDGSDVDAIAGVIREGVAEPVEYPGPMAPMGGASLSEEEVQALAAYVASIGG